MELTFNQLNGVFEALTALKNKTLPFKVSLIIAKDLGLAQKEMDFYIEQEREFANTYLEKDENGIFIQEPEGVFKILPGKEEECRAAREDLDKFTTAIDFKLIPVSYLENLELTPAEVGALELIIEED